jgi:hypothetical protein
MIIVLTTALGLALATSIYLAIELGKVKTEVGDRNMIISALQRQSEKDTRIVLELRKENDLLSKKATDAAKPVTTEAPKQAPRRSRKPKQAPKQA